MTKSLFNDPVAAKAFMRRIMGPPRRELKDEECAAVEVILALLVPIHSSNNQRAFTNEYIYNGQRYFMTYGLSDKVMITVEENDEP